MRDCEIGQPKAEGGRVLKKPASKMFFFEKKNQKTFAPLRACIARTARPDAAASLAAQSESGRANSRVQSFFCCFFVHKKEVLPS